MKTLPLPEQRDSQPGLTAVPGNKWFILIAIGIGTFMSALDTSVVNAVLPVVGRSFFSEGAAGVAATQWVVIVYLLVVSGLLLSFGRLGDLRGHRWVYLSGFIVFIVSSVLCSLAQSIAGLVAFRALQALGAAMISANSPAILTKNFPASQRGQALGLQATMTYLGLTVGPSLGGWLTVQFGWRSIFYINLPVGLFALLLAIRFIPHDHVEKSRETFDLPGSLLFMAGLVVLLLGLNQGHAWGWLSAPVLGLAAASAVFLAAFYRIEQRAASPMLDLSLFRKRLFTASTASAVLNYICVYSIIFLMPFYLIRGRQLDPSQAGLVLSVMPLVMAIVAPVSGTLSDRVGARLPSTLGMAVIGAGLFLLSRLGPASPLGQVALSLAVAGLGIGVFISPNNSTLMGAAPRHRQGIAAGVMATSRNVGMVLGVGLSGAIFTTLLSHASADQAGGLFGAVSASFLACVAVAGLGIITSAIRGGKDRPRDVA